MEKSKNRDDSFLVSMFQGRLSFVLQLMPTRLFILFYICIDPRPQQKHSGYWRVDAGRSTGVRSRQDQDPGVL